MSDLRFWITCTAINAFVFGMNMVGPMGLLRWLAIGANLFGLAFCCLQCARLTR